MSYFEKNLNSIIATNETFANRLKECSNDENITIINADNGMKNALIKNKNISFLMYDNTDPGKSYEMMKTIKFEKENVTVIVGCGLGHQINEICKIKETQHHIVLIEKNIFLLKKMFELYDLTEYLNNASLMVINSSDFNEIASVFGYLESRIVIQEWMYIIESYCMNLNDEYIPTINYVQNIINQINCNVGTVSGAGYQIAINDISNLPYIIRHRGVNDLENLFRNKTAVLISTGPSLRKNLHYLQKYRDNVIIIAVAQALRILEAYDITPDFITTVDYGIVNKDHFEGLWDSKVPLVCLNRTYNEILKKWQGAKFISYSYVADGENSLSDYFQKKKGSLEQGGSVSHFNLGLAIKLGCKNIIIIGQDLAYEDDISHFQADSSGKIIQLENGMLQWEITDPRSSIGEKSGNNVHSMGYTEFVEGYYNNIVKTNIGLKSFILTFETMIRMYPEINIINSTEGGAKIHGARQMSLIDALEIYGKKKINKSKIQELSNFAHGWKTDIKRAIVKLKEELKLFDIIIENSEKALEFNQKMMDATKEQLQKLLDENEKYTNIAHEAAKKSNLIGLYIYKDNREIQSKKMRASGKVEDLFNNNEDLEKRVTRNKLILEKAKEAAEKIKIEYEKTLNILEKYEKTKDESILCDNSEVIVTFDDVEKYFENNNFVHPLVDSKKVISNQDKYDQETIEKAKQIFLRANDMKNKVIADQKKYKENSKKIQIQNKIDELKKEGKKLIDEFSIFLQKNQEFNDNLELNNFFTKMKKIIKEFHSLEKIDYNNIDILWGLATTYKAIKDIDNAIEYYQKLINLFPESLIFKFELGILNLDVDLEKGILIIKEVMEKTKSFDYFYKNLGLIYCDLEKYDFAFDSFDKYLQIFTDLDILKKQIYCALKLNKFEIAKELELKLNKMTDNKEVLNETCN